jgi:hypothetical protein
MKKTHKDFTQEDKLIIIDWLFGQPSYSKSKTGRTTLMAIHFINEALYNNNTKIRVFDHVKTLHNSCEHILNEIRHQISSTPEYFKYKKLIIIREDSIKYIGPRLERDTESKINDEEFVAIRQLMMEEEITNTNKNK